jgi:hypothetical protein
MDLAYSSYSRFHLDLSKYNLTEEKCIDYHRKLMEAQRNNKEKNQKKQTKYISELHMHLTRLISYLYSISIQ